MQKTTLVVNRKFVREMLPGADLDRMLASGDNLVAVKPKKPSAHAIAQKEYLRRKRDSGFKKLEILLPADVHALLLSGLREGESTASLLARLLSKDDAYHLSRGEADK